jgi:hypothetical protein
MNKTEAILKSIFITSFFGWNNIKFVIRESIKMYSNEKSFFSKKRFETSVAFISGVGFILCYDWLHRYSMTGSEVAAHATILLGSAYYGVKNIQAEKLAQLNQSDNVETDDTNDTK